MLTFCPYPSIIWGIRKGRSAANKIFISLRKKSILRSKKSETLEKFGFFQLTLNNLKKKKITLKNFMHCDIV